MGPAEFETAPCGHYTSELIVANKQFFGHGKFPMQAHAQAAKSALAHFQLISTWVVIAGTVILLRV